MSRFHSLAYVLIVLIAACGGGGGGGGGGNTGGGSPPPLPPPPPPPPPGMTSTAKIVFPWQSSTATAQTITVGGTATDGDGVARVLINGVEATINTTVSAPGAINKTILAEGEVAWSAQVSLDVGDNVISVSVEDATGEIVADIDTATVKYIEVPVTFTLDPDLTRVVGLSFVLTPAGFEQNLVEHNYATNQQTVFGDFPVVPTETCFRRFEDEFLFLTFSTGSATYNLHRYEMSTNLTSLVAQIPTSALAGGAGFEDGSPRELVCGGTHTSAYVLVNHSPAGGGSFAKSRILEIDLGSANVTILSESDTTASPVWIAQTISLAEDRIVSMSFSSTPGPLTGVSLVDGTRSDLAPGLNVGGTALHPELASDRVYIANLQGVDEINLATNSMQNISPVGPDDPLVFAQVRDIGLDAANNRVLVGDSSLDTLIAVDITTGERSEFLARSAGTGLKLIAPRAFAIMADASRAYVVDDGGNAGERLFEIDLATGDRRVVGDIGQPFNYTASGLALDEPGNRVFVSFNQFILEVDLATEQVREVAHVDSTILQSIRGLLLDPANNRLLIGDPGNDGVYALDLTTEAIQVISQDNLRGSGPAFGVIISLTGPTAAGDIYAAGQASETVTRVNLATGDREAIMAPCNPGGTSDLPGLEQVLHHEEANELLMLAARIYRLDLAAGDCSRLPGTAFFLQIQHASANQLLATPFGALIQIDRETGQIVLVSK